MTDVGRMTGTSVSQGKATPLELGSHGNTRWRGVSRCNHHQQADGQCHLGTRALTGSRGSRDTSIKGPQHEWRQHGLGGPTWRSRGQPAGRRVTQSSCCCQERRAPPPGSPPTGCSQAWATRSGWPDRGAHRRRSIRKETAVACDHAQQEASPAPGTKRQTRFITTARRKWQRRTKRVPRRGPRKRHSGCLSPGALPPEWRLRAPRPF